MDALTHSFYSTMSQLLQDDRPDAIAVAVSGGADSMALALLANVWAKHHSIVLHALIVDHGLRAESAAEAQQVADWLQAHDIEAYILPIDMQDVRTAIQELARTHRYHALTAWCREHHINHLLLGHHRGDQAETILFRLLRHSRFDGLAGMTARRDEQGVALLRPLLNMPKPALQNFLTSQNQPWVDDPSNQNRHYSRVQMRQLIAAYPEAEARLGHIAQRFGRIRHHVETQLEQMIQRYVLVHPCGVVEVQHAMLDEAPSDMVDRLLVQLLMFVSGSSDLPRSAGVDSLRRQMMSERAATLHGCELKRAEKENSWLVYPEPSRLPPDNDLAHGQQRWGHFTVEGTFEAGIYTIGRLQESERREHKDRLHVEHPMTMRSILTLPVIRHLDKLHAIPHIGYYSDDWVLGAVNITFNPVKPLGNLPFFAMNDA